MKESDASPEPGAFADLPLGLGGFPLGRVAPGTRPLARWEVPEDDP